MIERDGRFKQLKKDKKTEDKKKKRKIFRIGIE